MQVQRTGSRGSKRDSALPAQALICFNLVLRVQNAWLARSKPAEVMMQPRSVALKSSHPEVQWPEMRQQNDPFGGVNPRVNSPPAEAAPPQASQDPAPQVCSDTSEQWYESAYGPSGGSMS